MSNGPRAGLEAFHNGAAIPAYEGFPGLAKEVTGACIHLPVFVMFQTTGTATYGTQRYKNNGRRPV